MARRRTDVGEKEAPTKRDLACEEEVQLPSEQEMQRLLKREDVERQSAVLGDSGYLYRMLQQATLLSRDEEVELTTRMVERRMRWRERIAEASGPALSDMAAKIHTGELARVRMLTTVGIPGVSEQALKQRIKIDSPRLPGMLAEGNGILEATCNGRPELVTDLPEAVAAVRARVGTIVHGLCFRREILQARAADLDAAAERASQVQSALQGGVQPHEGDDDLRSTLRTLIGRHISTPAEIRMAAVGVRTSGREYLSDVQELGGHNLRLVVAIAKRFRNRGVDLFDLIQLGAAGVSVAAHGFETDRDIKFGTYASWWIRQAIQRGLSEQAHTIRLPPNQVELLQLIRAKERELIQVCGRTNVTDMEIATALGVKTSTVSAVRRAGRNGIAFDGYGRDGDMSMDDMQPDDSEPSPFQAAQGGELADKINEVLRSLAPREREVIEWRFGLNGKTQKTLEEVAGEYGLTRERIRQIEAKAMNKLRHPVRTRKLDGFIRNDDC